MEPCSRWGTRPSSCSLEHCRGGAGARHGRLAGRRCRCLQREGSSGGGHWARLLQPGAQQGKSTGKEVRVLAACQRPSSCSLATGNKC